MESIVDYKKRLKSLRIKRIGYGYFASVYQHPTHENVVVKMVTRYDPLYVKYAEACMSSSNPWFPRILGIEHRDMLLRGRAVPIAFIFLEKLKEATDDDIVHAIKKFGGRMEECCFEEVSWRRVSKKKDPHLREVGELFHKLGVNDLHDANVMMRGKQLVFTDPVASGDAQ